MADKKDIADVPGEISSDIAKLSFEQALEQLEDIVRQLEGGESALEQALEAYERGAQLKRHCEAKLKQAQSRVEKISLAADGTPQASPAEVD
ncbi:MAG: exodeoxyribonuclease VII small subunit [Alphaproteobacteria bacterium]|nr:exodeoxyribonuclease VII small subunit [Alphaproteobacteria bacterium]MCZ6509717.1 exodeoxyribonuclease VII small subunit [Alphaproteobacteria bacterium]MCZ6588453.1 exodeoxyribonuclease VII small subunit [Alphaproteobacteria bacterium]MCZ6592483.1 exodeoxyribonuclease VII small subunit [Alphaproteobacteria bacterium]MCZ6837643.1 exodeoxyribonuclease VII small subunit [Alphaproteobacteria bacterium]